MQSFSGFGAIMCYQNFLSHIIINHSLYTYSMGGQYWGGGGGGISAPYYVVCLYVFD